MKTNIYVPSMGRANRVHTLASIPPKRLKDTYLVVPRKEGEEYWKANPKVKILGINEKGIGPTRDFCVNHAHKDLAQHMVMLDDDLDFAARRADDPTKFSSIGHGSNQLVVMFNKIDELLKTNAHVGVLAREGGNRVLSPLVFNNRMLRVLAYRVGVLQEHSIGFSRLKLMEDFDVTLRLLRMGYPNAVLAQWVQNQAGSNLAGGCSTYRTPEMQAAAAAALAKLHPGFVKQVTKKTKTAWGWGERQDVVIQWKKAFASSQVNS